MYICQKMEMIFLKILFISSYAIASESLPWIDANHGDELEFALPFLPKNPIILEAGAHYGEDTVVMANKWPQGKIFAFEPCPESFAKLQEAVFNHQNIQILPFGLFSKTGNYTFNVNTFTDGSSSLLDDNHVPGVTWYHDKPTTVFCMNLDEWVESQGITHIDYMWLDLEGAEIYVLEAAPKIVKTALVISTEVNFLEFRKGMSKFSDVRLLLESYGFILYKMWGVRDWQATALFIRSDMM